MVTQLCLLKGTPNFVVAGCCWLFASLKILKEIEFDAASNPYIATSTTAECLALIFMIVVGDLSTVRPVWQNQ